MTNIAPKVITINTNLLGLDNNIYVIQYKWKNSLVDCGFQNDDTIENIQKQIWSIDNLLITHWHFDHIIWIKALIKTFPNIKCYIHENEKRFLEDDMLNASAKRWTPLNLEDKYFNYMNFFKEDIEIDWINTLYSPWHTIWGVCYLIKNFNICFTWDILFEDSHWRTDFNTGNPDSMYESLNKVFQLNPETIIYPGHWSNSTLKNINKDLILSDLLK